MRLLTGVMVLQAARYVVVRFSDGYQVSIPFEWFEPNGMYRPDFMKTRVVDYGQTLALGDYGVRVKTLHINFPSPWYFSWPFRLIRNWWQRRKLRRLLEWNNELGEDPDISDW